VFPSRQNAFNDLIYKRKGDLSSDQEDRFYRRLARNSGGDFYLVYLITAKNIYMIPPPRCSSGTLQDFSGLLILFQRINPETSDQQTLLPPWQSGRRAATIRVRIVLCGRKRAGNCGEQLQEMMHRF
jgi:hypothetical protein